MGGLFFSVKEECSESESEFMTVMSDEKFNFLLGSVLIEGLDATSILVVLASTGVSTVDKYRLHKKYFLLFMKLISFHNFFGASDSVD